MKNQLKNKITEALNNLGIDAASFSLDRPDNAEHGDYSTNVALATAKQAGKILAHLPTKLRLNFKKTKVILFQKLKSRVLDLLISFSQKTHLKRWWATH
jgi:arginyl-tRNA synthetase